MPSISQYFVYFFLISANIGLASNSPRIDSLKTSLPYLDGLALHEAMMSIAEEYLNEENQEAIEWAERAINIPGLDTPTLVNGIRFSGSIKVILGQYHDVIENAEWAISLCLKSGLQRDQARLLSTLGNVYTFQGQYRQAFESHFKAMKIRETLDDSIELIYSYHNIGFLFYKLHNYAKALEFYNKSINLSLIAKDPPNLQTQYINTALCHFNLGNHKAGFDLIRDAFLSADSTSLSKNIKMEAFFAFGLGLLQTGQLDEAVRHFTSSLEISRELTNKRFEAENLTYLGKIYSSKNDIRKAIPLFQEAAALAKENDFHEIALECYKALAASFERIGDSFQASSYKENLITEQNHLHPLALAMDLAVIEADLIEKEVAKTYERQDRVRKARDSEMKSQKVVFWLISVLLTLLLVILFLTFKAFAQQRKISTKLHQRVLERANSLKAPILTREQLVDDYRNSIFNYQQTLREVDIILKECWPTRDLVAKKCK